MKLDEILHRKKGPLAYPRPHLVRLAKHLPHFLHVALEDEPRLPPIVAMRFAERYRGTARAITWLSHAVLKPLIFDFRFSEMYTVPKNANGFVNALAKADRTHGRGAQPPRLRAACKPSCGCRGVSAPLLGRNRPLPQDYC